MSPPLRPINLVGLNRGWGGGLGSVRFKRRAGQWSDAFEPVRCCAGAAANHVPVQARVDLGEHHQAARAWRRSSRTSKYASPTSPSLLRPACVAAFNATRHRAALTAVCLSTWLASDSLTDVDPRLVGLGHVFRAAQDALQLAGEQNHVPVLGAEHCPTCWARHKATNRLRTEPHHNAAGVFCAVCDSCGFYLVICSYRPSAILGGSSRLAAGNSSKSC
jgi:hypothetical protein